MNNINPQTPIIIGVGEYSERIDDNNYAMLSPVQLAVRASTAACANACEKNLHDHIDAIATVRTFEDTSPKLAGPFGKANCFPRAIAKHLGINPKLALWEVAGGQSPQHLVGEFCERLACGEISMALLTGAEAISTTRHLASNKQPADWSETVDGDVEDRGPGSEGISTAYMQKHMLYAAPQSYALLEHARRARLGLSREDYRIQMAELFAPFSKIAATNPHSMSHDSFEASALSDVTEKNRLIADPYPRRLVARDQVNQSAALLITTVAKAQALGIEQNRWVFLHGYADTTEQGLMEREDLGSSPAAAMAVKQALSSANIEVSNLNFMDLYSCFPIAVSNICDHLGISAADARGLTCAGGLPFFGGAGNNYSMHAIASLIEKLRAKPSSYGLIGANGGFMSKYSAGIYSTSPKDFNAFDSSDLQQTINNWPSPTICETPEGEAKIETYTVVYHKGAPVFAVVIGRQSENNQRFLAITQKADQETLSRMVEQDVIGQSIYVHSNPDANRFAFSAF